MKFGTFSIILDKKEYQYFRLGFNRTKDMLLKITHDNPKHNREIKNISEFREENDYTCALDDNIFEIHNPIFINYLKNEIEKIDDDCINILFLKEYKLIGYFVENLGNTDLFNIIDELENNKLGVFQIDTGRKLKEFTFQMCKALEYLKKKDMGHFDIKPENIIYNDLLESIPFGKRFKLIDFGFSDKYPFKNYRNNICGSLFYIPSRINMCDCPEWCNNIDCNDWKYNFEEGKHTHITETSKEFKLIYKSDIYSMGITFNQLLYYIKHYFTINSLILFENIDQLQHLISAMTLANIYKRFSIEQCLDHTLFKEEKKNCCYLL